MTTQEIITFILENGTNGNLAINEIGTEQIQIGIQEDGSPIIETHDFRYTSIALQREDLTIKRAEAQAILDAFS